MSVETTSVMTKRVQAIPDEYRSAIPYLTVRDAAGAIDFYRKAFGAAERFRMMMPNGHIGHAEIAIRDAQIMLGEPCEQGGNRDPQALGGSPVTILLYVEDVDAVVERAVAEGATLTMPVEDHFYGDRAGTLKDPFGHAWMIATHKEDLSGEELEARAKALFGGSFGG